MTQHVLDPETAADLPPGVAPSFGDVPLRPFEATPERLVLSSDEHSHLQPSTPINWLGGNFNHDRLGRGELRLYETTPPGAIHLGADVRQADGPAVHLDANVRESWVSRTVSSDDTAPVNVRIVRGLFTLAEIPGQSTVTISRRAG